ncbi:GATOR1 complex protein NPRL3 isoform X2 [Centruroides vittatus]|uniref:GATOR1 complex protein NPRL3 isoform X2 n=1 Tax=Centruroides vittatus TaxID=120091 RepID=UPI003510B901
MDEACPLGVFLVKSGSKGDRLLFRFPYLADENRKLSERRKKKNPYALIISEDYLSATRIPDKVLSNLFAVKPELCGKKFELKVNDVRFVGHPTQLSPPSNREPSTILSFNIVFALRANASHSIVNCYHDISKRLTIALHHEERRCGYVTSQAKMMLSAHDDVAALPEDSEESPYGIILSKSQLAKDLKTAYMDLKNRGSVHLKIHSWIEVSFCLPNKVHKLHNKDIDIDPEVIEQSLTALRPYHGMLLLVEVEELLDSLPHDSSPALYRLIRITSPLKSIEQLAADADISLPHVFQLVGHLVYWAKAMIIYPLCENNVYILSPTAPTNLNSPLVEKFSKKFPGMSLLPMLSKFSLPISLSQLTNPLNLPHQHAQQIQMVVWMLQHRLLMQLHTYINLICSNKMQTSTTIYFQENNYRYPSMEEPLSLDHGSKSESGSPFPSEESLTTSPNQRTPISEISSKGGSEEDLSCHEKTEIMLLCGLSPSERESILSVPSANNIDDLKLFARLCRYFRGGHHLEEIMYYENVRRSQLHTLLDKFRDVLITCPHEDAAVAAFYGKT